MDFLFSIRPSKHQSSVTFGNRLEGTLISILVVAEKPSVAMSYAKVLGATSRQDGYLEGNGYLVSWCVGHLVELAPPNVYDTKYVKWSVADLPILSGPSEDISSLESGGKIP